MNSASKRIFLAIEVSPEWKAAIGKFIEENKHLNYRWIAEENWHFTLLFIGDFPADKLNSIYPLLEKCFSEIPAFEIGFDTFTYFPHNRPRMVWCKGKESAAFASAETVSFKTLKHFCDEQYMDFNAKPSKKFIPHITLSRLKFIKKPLPGLQNFLVRLPPNTVREIVLFSSELKASGAQYTRLASFKLKV